MTPTRLTTQVFFLSTAATGDTKISKYRRRFSSTPYYKSCRTFHGLNEICHAKNDRDRLSATVERWVENLINFAVLAKEVKDRYLRVVNP